MNTNVVRKSLVVTVILLFIGVSIAPSINFTVVKASNDNDLVEVTSQTCGIKGFGNTTVKLTKQQYQNLEQYLVDFRARLNQTSTREEAVPIFKEAVVELNKYGLLPKGMSIERAQRLVTGQYQEIGERLIRRTLVRNRINDLNNSNYLCLVGSVTDNLTSVGPVVRWINNIMYAFINLNLFLRLFNFLYKNGFLLMSEVLGGIITVIVELLIAPWVLGPFITSANPFNVLYSLTLGGYVLVDINGHGMFYDFIPNTGWVDTFGLNGKRIFQNQPLWGNLPQIPITMIAGLGGYCYPGIFGFTGIQISLGGKMHHLGSALWVKIGSEHP
jgi:hypothetical protein